MSQKKRRVNFGLFCGILLLFFDFRCSREYRRAFCCVKYAAQWIRSQYFLHKVVFVCLMSGRGGRRRPWQPSIPTRGFWTGCKNLNCPRRKGESITVFFVEFCCYSLILVALQNTAARFVVSSMPHSGSEVNILFKKLCLFVEFCCCSLIFVAL